MNINFNGPRRRPTLACKGCIAYTEMAIRVAKVAKGNFYTHETLQHLRTPLALPTIQHTPRTTLNYVCNTSPNPPPIYHEPVITPGACTCHASSSKSSYHHSLILPHHPTLFPIFLRRNNTSKSKSPTQVFPLFYLALAPQPNDKISAHLHRLNVQKKALPLHPGLA
jgi:hypothetical protein